MNICPHCTVWNTAANDLFCSWCGHSLLAMDAELSRSRFSLADLPPPVDLVLANRSDSGPVTVIAVEPSDPWIKVDLGDNKLPLRLEPRSKRVVTVRVETVELAGYHSGSIMVRTNAGEKRLPIDLTPAPLLSFSAYSGNEHRDTCRFDILLDDRDLENNLVRISAREGVISVENISTDHPEWVKIRLPESCQLPVVLDARKSGYIDVRLEVDEHALALLKPDLPADHTANLVISYDEFSHEEPLVFTCWHPPVLFILEEADQIITDAWPGQHGKVVLTLQNGPAGRPERGIGNAPLRITRISIQEDDGRPCEWLALPTDLQGVVAITGGNHREVEFGFETDAAGKSEGKRLGLGRRAAVVVLTTNLTEVTYKCRVEVNVREIRDFRGVMAIDFGTSNTCCALFANDAERHRLVRLDDATHNPHPTTVPTVIQYLEESEGVAVTRIGAEVEDLDLTARLIRSTARSLKRKLGTKEPYEIFFFNTPEVMRTYSAKNVVRDYLRAVRKAAERSQPGVRFRKIVITHPSRFKLLQIMELKEAVKDAFGVECEIDLLPEPVAAALAFMMEEQALARERYTLGVFDFGGGTTDLSLIEVVNEKTGFMIVRPRQIGTTGRWFGGEDITRFVYAQGLEGCKRIAAADYRDQVLSFDPDTARGGNQQQLAVENHGRLLQWAERTKLLLLEHGDENIAHLPPNKPDLFPILKLSLWSGIGAAKEGLFRHDQIVPKREELDRFLRARVKELADELKKLVEFCKVVSVDCLRLSGKSSSIPLVREVLAEHFPQAQLSLAAEPKECIVEGACIKYKNDFAVGKVFEFEDSDFVRTTSSIGIEDAISMRFVTIIGPGVPVSKDGAVGRYENYPLRRGSRIRLSENTSLDTRLDQKNISPLGTFKIDPSYTGIRVVSAELELRLSQDLTPTLMAYIPNADPIPFVLEQDGKGGGY